MSLRLFLRNLFLLKNCSSGVRSEENFSGPNLLAKLFQQFRLLEKGGKQMHRLSKEQKLENLQETRQNLLKKIQVLQEQLKNLDAKISKLQSSPSA